tara:strand:+ start:51 stop:1136 length:1086 start_codon:yes stop_codon:yes gene_type:complete
MDTNEVVVAAVENQLTGAQMKSHVAVIRDVMQSVMRPGVHYGTIPGCGDKPTLLKPGAEALKMAFRLSDELYVEDLSPGSGEAHYRVTARLSHAPTQLFVGSGVGECSSLENKYAWRVAISQAEYDGTLDTHRRLKYYRDGQANQVRANPADIANTVLKMAKKRALVDAVLSCVAASDVFTQDIEDIASPVPERQGASAPRRSSESAPATSLEAGVQYSAVIESYVEGAGKSPHRLTCAVKLASGDTESLSLSFFERPLQIKEGDAATMAGKTCMVSFSNTTKAGRTFQNLASFSLPEPDGDGAAQFELEVAGFNNGAYVKQLLDDFGLGGVGAVKPASREEFLLLLNDHAAAAKAKKATA